MVPNMHRSPTKPWFLAGCLIWTGDEIAWWAQFVFPRFFQSKWDLCTHESPDEWEEMKKWMGALLKSGPALGNLREIKHTKYHIIVSVYQELIWKETWNLAIGVVCRVNLNPLWLSVILVPFLFQPKFASSSLKHRRLFYDAFDLPTPPILRIAWTGCNAIARGRSPCATSFPDRWGTKGRRDEGTKRNDRSEIKNNRKKQRWGYIMIYIYHICIYMYIYIFTHIHIYNA